MNVRIRRFSLLQITGLYVVRFAFAGQDCIQSVPSSGLSQADAKRHAREIVSGSGQLSIYQQTGQASQSFLETMD